MRRFLTRAGPSLSLILSNAFRSAAYLIPAPAIAWTSGEQALLIWMLFISLLSTQGLLMFGLPQVFIRATATANATQSPAAPGQHKRAFQFANREDGLREVQQAQHILFLVFSLIISGLFVLSWFFVLQGEARDMETFWQVALAWGVIVVLTPLRIAINRILSFLHGVGDILRPRLIDCVGWAGAGLAAGGIALWSSNLFVITLAFSACLALEYLVLHLHEHRMRSTLDIPATKTLSLSDNTKAVWKRLGTYWAPTWRSGLGLMINSGSRIWIGILFAATADPVAGSLFLFAQNLFGFVMLVGSAPLSASLQKMAHYYQSGDTKAQVSVALKATQAAMWLTALACVAILGVFVFLSTVLPADKQVDPVVWVLFSGALLAQRLGAAHLQHYSVTNRIIWHWVDGATAVAMLVIVFFAGLQDAVVIAGIVFAAHILVYFPIAMIATHRQFGLRFTQFDLRAAGPAVMVFAVLSIGIMMLAGPI